MEYIHSFQWECMYTLTFSIFIFTYTSIHSFIPTAIFFQWALSKNEIKLEALTPSSNKDPSQRFLPRNNCCKLTFWKENRVVINDWLTLLNLNSSSKCISAVVCNFIGLKTKIEFAQNESRFRIEDKYRYLEIQNDQGPWLPAGGPLGQLGFALRRSLLIDFFSKPKPF